MEPRFAHQFPDDLPVGVDFLGLEAGTNSVDLKVWAIAEVCFFACAPSDCDRLDDLEIQDCFDPAATEVNEARVLSRSHSKMEASVEAGGMAITVGGQDVQYSDGSRETLTFGTCIWAAGVAMHPLVRQGGALPGPGRLPVATCY